MLFLLLVIAVLLSLVFIALERFDPDGRDNAMREYCRIECKHIKQGN